MIGLSKVGYFHHPAPISTQISKRTALLRAGEGDPTAIGHHEGVDDDPQGAARPHRQVEGGRGGRRDGERLEVRCDGAGQALLDHLHRVHDARHRGPAHHRPPCHRHLVRRGRT